MAIGILLAFLLAAASVSAIGIPAYDDCSLQKLHNEVVCVDDNFVQISMGIAGLPSLYCKLSFRQIVSCNPGLINNPDLDFYTALDAPCPCPDMTEPAVIGSCTDLAGTHATYLQVCRKSTVNFVDFTPATSTSSVSDTELLPAPPADDPQALVGLSNPTQGLLKKILSEHGYTARAVFDDFGNEDATLPFIREMHFDFGEHGSVDVASVAPTLCVFAFNTFLNVSISSVPFVSTFHNTDVNMTFYGRDLQVKYDLKDEVYEKVTINVPHFSFEITRQPERCDIDVHTAVYSVTGQLFAVVGGWVYDS